MTKKSKGAARNAVPVRDNGGIIVDVCVSTYSGHMKSINSPKVSAAATQGEREAGAACNDAA
jgi:hypothetical protein